MEKLVYVVWKREADSAERMRELLLGQIGTQLRSEGACRITASVTDEHVRFAQKAAIGQLNPPMTGIVSLWLDTHLDRAPCESLLSEMTDRLAGYLVLESQPIVNTSRTTPPGERTPGVNTIGFLEQPPRLQYEEWREIWQGSHTQIAIDTQSTFLYTQNVVVRALTEEAPAWAAIVEEGFPRDAFVDPKVFYDAGDSEEKLNENRGRMVESCRRFIDFERLESHPFSHYVICD